MQHAKSATGAECKTKTLQRVKVKHEIEQYLKRVQHEDTVQHEKITTQKSTTYNWCNMKKVQHEKIWISTVKYGKSAQE